MSVYHVTEKKVYIRIFTALLFLTVLTVVVAKPITGVDFGIFNTLIAMFIATIKAGLVLAFFMHLLYEDKVNWVIIFSSLFFLGVLFVYIIIDVHTRIPVANPL